MEEQGELFRVISQSEQFGERTARYLFRQLVGALRHLHGRGMAHGDVKSENLLLDSKFNLKVVDFGCARPSSGLMPNEPIGSRKCNAPEIVNQEPNLEYNGEAVDVFGAGCFLFELVMKCEPFRSSEAKDEHYGKLASLQTQQFW